MKLSEYEIVVKSLRKNQRKVITTLGLPKIGTDMKKKAKQLYRLTVEK